LVLSTIYTNFLVGTPNTAITNLLLLVGTNSVTVGTNLITLSSLISSQGTNVYAVTNETLLIIPYNNFVPNPAGAVLFATITTNIISTNGTVVATINTNAILDGNCSVHHGQFHKHSDHSRVAPNEHAVYKRITINLRHDSQISHRRRRIDPC
jgi:hypothetical protein